MKNRQEIDDILETMPYNLYYYSIMISKYLMNNKNRQRKQIMMLSIHIQSYVLSTKEIIIFRI